MRGEPFQLGRWTVPPGIEINPSIAGVHRRADRYPSPESFRPERFLGEDAPDGFTWIPFGGGTRRCLGASFALFEMKTVVTRVLERTSLEPVGKPGHRRAPGDHLRAPQRGQGASDVGEGALQEGERPCPPPAAPPAPGRPPAIAARVRGLTLWYSRASGVLRCLKRR